MPGSRNKFGAPMFEPEVIRKQFAAEESRPTCDIVRTFRRPGNRALLPPSLLLWSCCVNSFHVDFGYDRVPFVLAVTVALFMVPVFLYFFKS